MSSSAFAEKGEHKKRGKRPDFVTIDTNEDGEISFDEFSQLKIRRGEPQTIFNKIDTDGSGSITKQEFSDHKPPRKGKKQKDNSDD
jgi:hypothetical protein